MASSPLPCPLTHRLINGGREQERPGTTVKTKDAVVVRGASEIRKAEPRGRGTRPQGCWESGKNSQREGQNDRQGQGHGATQGRRRRQMRGQRDGQGERGKAQSQRDWDTDGATELSRAE